MNYANYTDTSRQSETTLLKGANLTLDGFSLRNHGERSQPQFFAVGNHHLLIAAYSPEGQTNAILPDWKDADGFIIDGDFYEGGDFQALAQSPKWASGALTEQQLFDRLPEGHGITSDDLDPLLQHSVYVGEGQWGLLNDQHYLASNPDVLDAYGHTYQGAMAHYRDYGYAENRSVDSFDGQEYLEQYPDVAAQYGMSTKGAIRHFVSYGFNEGRIAYGTDFAAPVTLETAF